ncbi:hypothetical protein B0H14DRAFT_3852211, partial [Mycena olivaceomarginata]
YSVFFYVQGRIYALTILGNSAVVGIGKTTETLTTRTPVTSVSRVDYHTFATNEQSVVSRYPSSNASPFLLTDIDLRTISSVDHHKSTQRGPIEAP